MSATVAETATLAHGYTMAEIDSCARAAFRIRGNRNMDAQDGYDYAWHAIVELLYSSRERPTKSDLIHEGGEAVRKATREDLRARGYRTDTFEPMVSFGKYWRPFISSLDDFSEDVAQRLALPQVLAKLTPTQYEAVSTLAAYGSPRAAADALGVDVTVFYARMRLARIAFLTHWFDHETPRRIFPNDSDDRTCKHGHDRSEHGYKNRQGKWVCRRCLRNSSRRYRATGRRGGSKGLAS